MYEINQKKINCKISFFIHLTYQISNLSAKWKELDNIQNDRKA